MNVSSVVPSVATVVGGDFNDPTNERLIYLSALGLVVVGTALLVGTIVWWRRGRQEHPALAPLEVMSTRAWSKAPEGDRRRRLDQVRLNGSGATVDEVVRSEPVDLEALVRSVPQAFDDLREPGEHAAAEPISEEPAAAEGEADPTQFVARPEPDGDVEVAAPPETVASETAS